MIFNSPQSTLSSTKFFNVFPRIVIQSEAKDLEDIHLCSLLCVTEIFRTSPQQLVFTTLRFVLNDKYYKTHNSRLIIYNSIKTQWDSVSSVVQK